MKMSSKLILLFILVASSFVSYMRCGQKEVLFVAIGICTYWDTSKSGAKPHYCDYLPDASKIPPNPAAGKCVSCDAGYTVGYCADGLYWQSDVNGKQCGKDAGLFGGQTGCAPADRCYGVGGTPIQTFYSGFLSTGEEPLPANVLSISPSNGSTIYPNTTVTLQTSKSVDGNSVILSGSIGNFIGNNFELKRKDIYNDQLIFQLEQNVPKGVHKTLVVKGKDLDGKDLQINLNYSILANGQSASISSSTCQPECLVRWIFDSYAIPFSAQGGFPPYTWYMNGEIPPGAVMSLDGVLSGPPTGNFLGKYYFVVTVVDSNNSVANFSVSINSFDLGAACFFAGICW
ncbi:hypothetical protein JWG44_05420 [Leptospira sp. 201903071]|nr:hypothetical protein [Leptospira ainazelensis]